jgi:hypothetical protein
MQAVIVWSICEERELPFTAAADWLIFNSY